MGASCGMATLSHFGCQYDEGGGEAVGHEGDISQEELDRIRWLLGKRLRQQLGVPPATPEGDKPPEPPPKEPRPGQSE